uniref:Uncharacterized protein n=1 Tax=viral metagenome TaxID=1070528 RepID=A0A6M3J947_9ZZZZ
MINPYPKTIIDEVSGTEIPNQRYDDWLKGYAAAYNEKNEYAYQRGYEDAVTHYGENTHHGD